MPFPTVDFAGRRGKAQFDPRAKGVRSPREHDSNATTMLVAFGSNLASTCGRPAEIVRRAIEVLAVHKFEIEAASALFKSPAFPPGSGPDFVNAVARVGFDGSPEAALAQLKAIEVEFGRDRKTRWEPRTLDLDLLAAGQLVLPDAEAFAHWCGLPPDRQSIETPAELILPHPRLQDRAFVLVPLAEVAPDWRHPVLGLTVTQMCARLPDVDRAAVRRLVGDSSDR